MRPNVAVVAAALALVCSTLLGCPALTGGDVCLWGRVDLDGPVEGATVVVCDAASGDKLWEGPTEAGGFYAMLTQYTFPVSGKDLRLTATGGTVGATSLSGTITAYVPAYVPDDHLEVNILTTLIVEYMRKWDLPYDEAREDVFDYLELPRDYALIDRAHQDSGDMYFDEALFLEAAAASGGFDAYVRYLAENTIGWGGTQDFSALSIDEPVAAKSSVFDLGGLAASAGKWLGGKLLSAAGDWAGKEALGWVLSLFGFQDSTDARFDAIDRQLKQMDGKLDTIMAGMTNISQQVDGVLTAVNVARNQIIMAMSGVSIGPAQSVINNQFVNLKLLVKSNGNYAHTETGYAKALAFAQDITSGAHDIDQQLTFLHDGIVGKTVGSTGFLDACTDVLIDKANAKADLFKCYLALENSFCELVVVEYTGLYLMAEAMHIKNDDVNSGPKSYEGTFQDYYTEKFLPNIREQVDKFMTCVDSLVVSQIDVRTDVGNPLQFLPNNSGSVYERADFCAHLLDERHPAGLIVRLIGTPLEVHNAIANGAYVKVSNSHVQCLPEWGGRGTNTVTTTIVTLPPVAVNGAAINAYPAALPSYYGAGRRGYFEWSTSSDGVYVYHVQPNIAVAKLAWGTKGTPTVEVRPVSCRPGSNIDRYDEQWSIEPGLTIGSHGTPESYTKTYTDQFVIDANGTTSYGFRLIPLRMTPTGWKSSQQWNQVSRTSELKVAFDPYCVRVASSGSQPYGYSKRYGGYDCIFNATTVQSLSLKPLEQADADTAVKLNSRFRLDLTFGMTFRSKVNVSASQQSALGDALADIATCSGATTGIHGIQDAGEFTATPLKDVSRSTSKALPLGKESSLRLIHNTVFDSFINFERTYGWARVNGTQGHSNAVVQYSGLELVPQ